MPIVRSRMPSACRGFPGRAWPRRASFWWAAPSCAVAYVLYGARLRIRQGRLTLIYAAVVAVLSVIAIATTVVFNEWFEEHSTRLPYETIFYFVVILALHVWSYMSRTANAVAIAILYLVSAMVTRNLLVYLSVGTLPTTYLVLPGITGLAGVGVLTLESECKLTT